jgi:gluconate 5-dehydrogenase
MFDLKGKTALITGGSSGLGYAMAKTFAENGAKVIITGRNAELLEKAKITLGENVSCEANDVSDLKATPEFVEMLETKYGPIDILVNNAGKHCKKPTHELTDEELRQVFDVNLFGVFALTREVGKRMVERKRGTVILVSSMSALFSLGKVAAYASSKASLKGLMLDLVAEYGNSGVRINIIAPGFIETPMFKIATQNDASRLQKIMGRIPMGRLGQPEDISSVALFFASDASRYVTGTLLPVDGGCAIGF